MSPDRLAKLRAHAADPACTSAERAAFTRKIEQATRVSRAYGLCHPCMSYSCDHAIDQPRGWTA